jgi:hypothetical protein
MSLKSYLKEIPVAAWVVLGVAAIAAIWMFILMR